MSFATQVLRWMLKRVEQDRPIVPERCDLVHVRTHQALEPAPTSLEYRDRVWRVVPVSGELGLRRALLDASPLIALLPEGFDPPLDLNDRAYRRRVLVVEAQDLVAAAAGRYSVRIRDEVLARTILDAPEALERSAQAWTLGPSSTTVTEDEVRSVLLAAAMGLDRKLERFPPESLLARWIAEGPPRTVLGALLDNQFERAFGLEGRWLARARQASGLAELIAAGALAGTEAGRKNAPVIEGIEGAGDERSWSRLRRLVESAVREARAIGAAAQDGLQQAEKRFHKLRATPEEAGRFPLVRAALESALSELARDAAGGRPPSFEVLGSLRRNLHHSALAPAVEAVELAGRLARFLAVAPGLEVDEPERWLELAPRHLAWVDLALRQLRRRQGELSADIAGSVDRLQEKILAVRDRWNSRFADNLVANEPQIYGQRDRRGPLPLSSVSRALLHPLVKAGHRVFLVVLDGCDLSTFLELVLSDLPEVEIGLALPQLSGELADDLRVTGPLNIGVAPLPTLTLHARRALFAGALPQNPILDEDEASAANASADRQAFVKNPSLGDIPRRLLLKDEIGVDGKAVLQALDDPELKILAAVFNGVDDALSSHQMTAMPEWTWANVGGGLQDALHRAFKLDWTVLLTADHGHTPFVHPDRKAEKGTGTGGHRWRRAPFDGAVMLPAGALRSEPIYALTQVGGWFGPQARGFHGGVSLEEVAVPLAFLGRVNRPAETWPSPPWWTDDMEALAEPGVSLPAAASLTPATAASPGPQAVASRTEATPVAAPAQPPARARVSVLSPELRAELDGLEHAQVLLEHIARKQQLGMSALAKLAGVPAFLVRGRLSKAQARLYAAGLPVPFDEEERDGEAWYRWKD